jgi:hypothetical protein
MRRRNRKNVIMNNVEDGDVLKALDELFGAIDKYRTSEGFHELLAFLRKLPGVGAYNGLLLHIQRPGATYVATVNGWQRHGRVVKRQANPLVTLRAFGPVEFVYDIEDTTGPPLPRDAAQPFHARGEMLPVDVFDRSVVHAQADKIAVIDADFGPQLAGRVSGQLVGREQICLRSKEPAALVVELNRTLSVESKYATLVHELAHVYCGHLGVPRGGWWQERTNLDKHVKEFEAEAVAWIVCARQGLDPGSYKYLEGYLTPGRSIPPISLNELVVAANHIELLAAERFRAKAPERKNAAARGIAPDVLSVAVVPSPEPTPTAGAGWRSTAVWRGLVRLLCRAEPTPTNAVDGHSG